LAKAAGVSVETVRAYEQGKRTPSASVAERMQRELRPTGEAVHRFRRAAGLRASKRSRSACHRMEGAESSNQSFTNIV